MLRTTRAAALTSVLGISLALGACSESDPNTYAVNIDVAKQKLAKANSQYVSGNQTRYMRGDGWAEKGLNVHLWNSGSFKTNCKVLFEEVDAESTRIVPSCGAAESVTAQGRTVIGFLEMEIAAHVNQILTGTPIDADKLRVKMTASTMKNMPAMQGEALAADKSFRAQRNAQQARANRDGWGGSNASDDSALAADGWGSN